MKKKSISRSAFLSVRGLIALFLCASACFIAVGTVPAFLHPEARAKVSHPAAAGLTFAERVAYQRAIEEVYWRHRIWPKDNPQPKPPLEAIVSEAQLKQKVEGYLRKSQLVTDQRRPPITASELQAEMDRIAHHTKRPEMLREFFEALGNDPFIIAECLARPIVAERLSASSTVAAGVPPAGRNSFAAGMTAFTDNRVRAQTNLDNAAYELPEIPVAAECTDDTWIPTTTANAPDGRFFFTAVWTGSEMIVWGGVGNSSRLNTGGKYDPSTDSWTSTSLVNAPSPRDNHSAVWIGTEMIVWGGEPILSTGGRYNPITDSWTATSTANAPTARAHHTAVWTGGEMIVWGGYNCCGDFNSGGRYNPSTDAWTATSTINAPEARWYHSVEWTGSEMIVWGGTNQTIYVNTGGRYNPSTDSWTATGIPNDVLGRAAHSAVWTGSEMIVWGGVDSTFNDCNTGGRYDATSDSWMATNIANAPSPRDSHTAVWTGSEMIIWGGIFCYPCMDFNNGGRYNPGSDSWVPASTANAPFAREDHTAVWSGSEMIVWGGYNYTHDLVLNTGGRYCAQSQAPMAQSAFSRKTHGAAGTFDVPLPLTGNVGIECRSGGATNDYQMIINFATSVTVENALVTSGTGSVSSFSVSGSQVTVNLTGVTNVQRITVTLFNVNDGTHMGNVPVSMGVLVGDVNGNGLVNSSDVSLTKWQVGQPVTGSDFREDVNANGVINSVDVALVKSKVGTALPP
ncbi:MAG: dockerin type I domain-containing protein [Chthoniobacterales bacterium]